MKGYLSFILIFAAMLAVLSAFAFSIQARGSNLSTTIALEKTDDISLQHKQLILEAASQGIAKGLGVSTLKGEKDVLEIKKNIVQNVHQQLSNLSSYSSDSVEMVAWCGYVNSYDIRILHQQMMTQKRVLICDGCSKLDSDVCSDFISVNNDFSVSFSSPSIDPTRFGVIGISTHDKKYSINSVSYIPASTVIPVIK